MKKLVTEEILSFFFFFEEQGRCEFSLRSFPLRVPVRCCCCSITFSRNQSSDKLITFSILESLDTCLDPQYSMKKFDLKEILTA